MLLTVLLLWRLKSESNSVAVLNSQRPCFWFGLCFQVWYAVVCLASCETLSKTYFFCGLSRWKRMWTNIVWIIYIKIYMPLQQFHSNAHWILHGTYSKSRGIPGGYVTRSVCMYVCLWYVCMYVCTSHYFLSSATSLDFLSVRKACDEAEKSAQHSAAQPVEPTDAQRSALFGSYT